MQDVPDAQPSLMRGAASQHEADAQKWAGLGLCALRLQAHVHHLPRGVRLKHPRLAERQQPRVPVTCRHMVAYVGMVAIP